MTTCLSIDCPDKRSTCCNAFSQCCKDDYDNGFECSNCEQEFVGGKCNAPLLNQCSSCITLRKEIESLRLELKALQGVDKAVEQYGEALDKLSKE